MRTACDVMREAQKKYTNPSKLEKDEVDGLVEDLYYLLEEMHGMAVKMEERLYQYHDFVKSFVKEGNDIVSA